MVTLIQVTRKSSPGRELAPQLSPGYEWFKKSGGIKLDGSGNTALLYSNKCCSLLVLLFLSGSQIQCNRKHILQIRADSPVPLDTWCGKCFACDTEYRCLGTISGSPAERAEQPRQWSEAANWALTPSSAGDHGVALGMSPDLSQGFSALQRGMWTRYPPCPLTPVSV